MDDEPRPLFPQTVRADSYTPRPFIRRTVLIVDDEASIREVFGIFLRQVGHTVIEATDGAEAQRATMEHPDIDVLLTDYNMPGMNGVELANWFRRTFPKTRIMVVSGAADAAPEAAAHGLPLLEKPVPLWALARAVEQLAGSEAE